MPANFCSVSPAHPGKPARVGESWWLPLVAHLQTTINPSTHAVPLRMTAGWRSRSVRLSHPLRLESLRGNRSLTSSVPHHSYINIQCSLPDPDRARGCRSSGSERRSCDTADAVESWDFLISRLLLDGASPSETSAVVFVVDQPC